MTILRRLDNGKAKILVFDKHRIGIVEKATNSTTKENATTDYASISEVKDLRLYGIMKPDALTTNLTNASDPALTEIPSQFHEVIVNKVVANGYKDPRNMNIEAAQYFDIEYEKGVKEGKKFSKSNYSDVGFIRQQDF